MKLLVSFPTLVGRTIGRFCHAHPLITGIAAITPFIILALVLLIIGCGIAWITGGSGNSKRFLRSSLKKARGLSRTVLVKIGRTIGVFCQKHSLLAGITAIAFVLYPIIAWLLSFTQSAMP